MNRNIDIAEYMRIRVIGTYAKTKQFIELLDREYVSPTTAIHYTPKLAPHPGLGTTKIIINYLNTGGGDTA
ncbi:MAG: hypothetical protein ACRDPW_03435 [Mycobacteriales bacterium]